MCTQYSNNSSTKSSPIILLHGWGMNANIWQPIINNLSDTIRSRITTLNLPGYNSEPMPEEYELNNLADWLNNKISEPSIILGWSLGGLVAQQFALQYPDKVDSLGLIASSPKFLASEQWPGIDANVLNMFASQLAKNHKQTIERFLAIQAMGSETAKNDIKELKELILSAPEPNIIALSKGLELLEKIDLRSNWSKIQTPIHCLFGRLDSLVPNKAIKLIDAIGEHVQVTKINKASHAPFISHPNDFAAWMEKVVN